jgi:hypothetical protein
LLNKSIQCFDVQATQIEFEVFMKVTMRKMSDARQNPGSSYYRPTPALKCKECNIIRPTKDFFSVKSMMCKECKK